MSTIKETTTQEQNHTPIVKPEKAKAFRKAHGYSLTMSKLMKKWNCATQEEWRLLRKKHKKENYIGPKREKNKAKEELAPWLQRDIHGRIIQQPRKNNQRKA